MQLYDLCRVCMPGTFYVINARLATHWFMFFVSLSLYLVMSWIRSFSSDQFWSISFTTFSIYYVIMGYFHCYHVWRKLIEYLRVLRHTRDLFCRVTVQYFLGRELSKLYYIALYFCRTLKISQIPFYPRFITLDRF